MLDSTTVVALIAAGGTGSRLGNAGGKQLLEVAGRPVVSWTVDAMSSVPEVDRIIVVTDPDRIDEYAQIVTKHQGSIHAPDKDSDDIGSASDCTLSFVGGGDTRTESVRKGLDALLDILQGDSSHNDDSQESVRRDSHTIDLKEVIVLIHDGARPLATGEMIHRALHAFADDVHADGLVVAHQATDTLKQVEDGYVVQTPPREQYWAVQTPQIFKLDMLLKAYEYAQAHDVAATDDASLAEAAGFRVAVFEGPRDNIKVTCPEDIEFVESALRTRG